MSSVPDIMEIERTAHRWFSGGSSGNEDIAQVWSDKIGRTEGGEGDLRRLALAAQALQVAFVPANAGALTFKRALPALPCDQLPEGLRPLFRRLVDGLKEERLMQVLWLLANRGFAVHPLDWLPSAKGTDSPPQSMIRGWTGLGIRHWNQVCRWMPEEL